MTRSNEFLGKFQVKVQEVDQNVTFFFVKHLPQTQMALNKKKEQTLSNQTKPNKLISSLPPGMKTKQTKTFGH